MAFKGIIQVRNMCSNVAMIRPPIQVFGTEGKYATALYSAAAKSKKLDEVEKELTTFQGMLHANNKTRDYLMDPTVNRTVKQQALLDISKQNSFTQVTANFLGLVAGNGRLNTLDHIVNSYKLMMSAQRGEVICEVVTAKPLDADQKKELDGALKAFLKPGQQLILKTKVDESLIGGMVVSIGDNMPLICRNCSGCQAVEVLNKMETEAKVLSIQSHVVFGYVGNRSAAFPLQYMGIEVDSVNSVQFSNHTGYGKWKGQVLSASDLDDLYAGLKVNNLTSDYTHSLSGYVGDDGFLMSIVKAVADLKKDRPGLVYLCDPVLGDYDQGLYVPSSLVPIYRDLVVPLADIICPNQFEAELLTDSKINSVECVLKAVDALHQKGPRIVVISSAEIDSKYFALVSEKVNGNVRRFKAPMQKLLCNFTGTGDLFASLFLANYINTSDVGKSLRMTVASMQDTLKKTAQHAERVSGSLQNARTKDLELRLVQSRAYFVKPETEVKLIEL
ncbi:unnamed protein product [Notodromas monacha]|uniref:pyridoxal kinase n=1 Tax=Notodromas monacha TaxID=399045 RepID=A0A7R9GDE7_9CRUS|nr:unnamed protein product [Notodromas monacha]CAG0916850.1 unnamed protein product [Notodromas monacha]